MSDNSKEQTAAPEEGGGGEETTLEFNLRLDGDGRTIYDPAAKEEAAAPSKSNDGEEPDAKKAKLDDNTSPPQPPSLDYSSKTIMTNLAHLSEDATTAKQLDELLFDCEITDSGLLPRTFWMSANTDTQQQPRCYLEKMALEVFHHHVPSGFYYDPKTSGAEWWVQIRPSPPAGRYSMHANDDDGGEDDMAKSGISFHWDKDEDFRLLTGGSLYIHPHISTVTYLTDLGAPTMVLSKRVDPMSGAYVTDADDDGSMSNVDGLVSFPKQGKHLSFDGRYLHAAPSDLLRDGLFEEQCKFDRPDGIDMKEMKVLERRHRRVSFLVNVWLNYHPYNVHPFPETMISNLSKMDLLGDVRLFDKCDEAKKSGESVTLKLKGEGKIQCEEGSVDEAHADVVTKNWPMGNCSNDCIDVPMPVDLMKSRNAGDDVKLIWRGEDIKLSGTSS
mmetsp:Transcript_28112/g.47663  ORF Transcript_28112/g.47663 Transcript_28112/m.47663 type:complete len:443 (-) Transcript_28112:2123-3451(-)